MSRARRLALLAAVAVALFGAVASMGPARLTALNAGLRADYPWPRPAAALLAVAAGLTAGVLVRARWLRLAAAAWALAAGTAALHLTLYRVDAGPTGLRTRGLTGSRHLAWEAVARVDSAPDLLLLTGSDGLLLRVDTTDFRAEDRATFDRTIARRLRRER